MSNVHIVTDSVAGIPQNLAEEYHIKVIPGAHIIYDGTTYIDGVTLSVPEAYELIKKDPDRFTTSALTPGYILDEYRELSKKTSEILHITMPLALSANFKTAGAAAEMLRQESPQTSISVLDSKTVAGAQGLVVLAAAKAAAQGKSLEEITSIVGQVRQKTGGIMMWDTLRYVYRTGRMSKMAARLVSLLNMKPINRVADDGSLEVVGRVRKRKDGYQKLIELVKAETKTDSLHFMLMHAAAPEMADEFTELLKQEFNCLSILVSEYSPVMGYATGPGALFVGFHPELGSLEGIPFP